MSRPRLVERLDRGARSKLTLISAPAGFGKTTLLAEWLATAPTHGLRVAWLSLDQGDNQSASFWRYLIGALQTAHPEVGGSTTALLQSAQPPPIDSLLTALLNDIGASSDDVVLVLDDYHLIDAHLIHEGIAFLIDHLPPPMRLVIASRADPPLPLALLRGRGELVEVRAADLRFTVEEAAEFLNETMGLDLSARDMAVLDARTEGWIAGLQLAALSMQGRNDVAGFIAAFTGDDRYIVDYLVEEVLERQPDDVRRFLLQTSILDRLTGPLCDAVTGEEGSRAILESLERGNLFVVPLDDRRKWYRYHHLFADVLQAHLREEQPDQIASLHIRASDWFEQQGELPRAIGHAFAAADVERAAALIELAMPALAMSRQDATLRGWVEMLPDELVRRRPVLNAGYVALLLNVGEFETVERRLEDSERSLETATAAPTSGPEPSGRPVFVDEQQFRDLPSMIALYRAGYAQVTGNLPDTTKYARRALELMPEEHPLRGAALALLGLALWSSGDLEAAHRTFAEGIARVHKAGYVNDSSGIMLAEIRIGQGRLLEAQRTYEQSLQRALEHGEPVPRGTADLHVGISELCRERGDLVTAEQHLLSSRELGELAGLPENRYRWYVAMAGIKRAQGDLDGALELLCEAERLYAGGFSPDVRPIGALKANVWVAQGRIAKALDWVREQGLSIDDEMSYQREFEHMTLAQVLIASSRQEHNDRFIQDAVRLLNRILTAADEAGRTGSVIETLRLQALAYEAGGDISAALAPLERALTLAEPEGYVRLFVDEGEPMRALLRHAAAAGIRSAYTRRLLAAFDGQAAHPSPEPRVAAAAAGLADPLTARETEILRLVAAGMTNQEIADHLVISLATVKRHIANGYGKLGVGHRTEAVARANELSLL